MFDAVTVQIHSQHPAVQSSVRHRISSIFNAGNIVYNKPDGSSLLKDHPRRGNLSHCGFLKVSWLAEGWNMIQS